MINHICPRCQKAFETQKRSSKFCSHTCALIFRWSPDLIPRTTEQKNATSKKWRSENREHINFMQRKYNKLNSMKPEWIEKQRSRSRYEKRELRHAAIMAYGGYRCSCNHRGGACGEKPPEFLCIDHINGNGKILGEKGGHILYRRLKKQGYPPGYRVLCHNCNLALGFYGYCPESDTEKQIYRGGSIK